MQGSCDERIVQADGKKIGTRAKGTGVIMMEDIKK